MTKYAINPQYENEYKDFLLNTKEHFNKSDQTIHKARNELKIIPYKDERFVIKAFKTPNLINRFAYAYIRDGKAKKSYQNALKLRKLNVLTPEPIGYIEFYKNTLLYESFYISKYVPYDYTIREPLRDFDFPDREKILKAFVAFTYDLHKKNIYHKDFSAGNTLVIDKKDHFEFYIVDINRLEFKTITLDIAMQNFDKLWLDEENLAFIAKEYAKLSGFDKKECKEKIFYYDKRLKNFVQRRRMLKKRIFGK